jgi:transcriptional regulator with XRE-family HTH domain
MKTNDIFNLLHNAIESKFFGKKISQREMAQKLGISMRTYQDWRLGNSNPQAAIAIFKMLSELEDEEILRITKRIRTRLKEDKSE